MRLILFDYDGVIADTLADMIQFAQDACDELAVQHVVIPSNLQNLEVMSFATFGRACGVPESLVGEFVRICTGKFAAKKTPPAIFDGLPNVIRRLSDNNILSIVTGNTVANVNAFLSYHKLQSCFHVVYGVDIPGSKVEKILKLKSQFEVKEESPFFVGDSLSDIRAAREANVKSVAVGWGHQHLDMLVREQPDVVVLSPVELLKVFGEADGA